MFSDDSLADYYGPFGGGKIEASLTVDHTLVEPGDKVRLIGKEIWINSPCIIALNPGLSALFLLREACIEDSA